MSFGFRLYNSAGQVSLDTAKLGGVALASQFLQAIANTTYTYSYTIPNGKDVKVGISPVNAAFRLDLATITQTLTTNTFTFTFNPGNVSMNLYIIFILI
jgi:hypothetical protein